MKYKNRLTFAYFSITFEILNVFKVFQEPDKCQKQKITFLKDAQISKYRFL